MESTIIKGLIFVATFYCVFGLYGIVEMFVSRQIWTEDFKVVMEKYPVSTVFLYFISFPISWIYKFMNEKKI